MTPRYFLHKVQVRLAGKKGRGMFALAPIKTGEVIEAAPTLLIPRGEVDELLTSFLGHYIFRTDKGRRYVVGLGYTSLFNHGAKPNAEFFVTERMVKIKALRPIKRGEEVTVAYGWTKSEWEAIGGVLA